MLTTHTFRYGVALIGIQTDMRGTWPIMLNPGPGYILKSSDICFYMNISKEENSAFLPASSQEANKLKRNKKLKYEAFLKVNLDQDVSENGRVVAITELMNEKRNPDEPEEYERSSHYNSLRKAVRLIASKTTRKIRKKTPHLEIPTIEYGSSSRDVSPCDVSSARGRRRSIAPVPAMFKQDTEDIEETEDKDKPLQQTLLDPNESEE